MKEKKVKALIYEDLGFPILLMNVPMKLVYGDWVLNINLGKLQMHVLNMLIHKPTPLSGRELKFIRAYFEMTTTEFGKVLGVTHVAILKWENEQNRINSTVDQAIRLFVLDRLKAKDSEFRKFYKKFSIEHLVRHRIDVEIDRLLEIDARDLSVA